MANTMGSFINYRPDEVRGEIMNKKKIKKIGAILVMVITLGVSSFTVGAAHTDVMPGSWYYNAVRYVIEHGIMTGMDNTYFGTTETLKRAQFAVVLYRMAGKPSVEYERKFWDVQEEQWYTDAIMWASKNGIVTGYTDGSGMFGVADSINREQMVTMMYRYAAYQGIDRNSYVDLTEYPDEGAVNDFAYEAMQWSVAVGIIKGDGGYINPQGETNRAVCATIITRFLESNFDNGSDEEIVPPQNPEGQNIADYARQFVGKLPYVTGGTSLVTGADCSGFTQAIYEKFGWNIGRTTDMQENVGMEISYAEVEPGDLVFFANHVGIYSGNGKVIHSPEPGKMIAETSCSYMGTIIQVRRVL